MKKLLKEPFFHFILIGCALFLLYSIVGAESNSKDVIIIDDSDIDNFIAKWEMQWNRQPTEKELEDMIQQNIYQEVFYREALKMNLDENDEIIKRRLSQKMQFLSNDLASLKKVTDEELETYYKENSEKYLTPTSYSLYQIVFTSDNRTNPQNDAKAILNSFPNASFDEMKSKGDKLPFSYQFIDVTSNDLALQLGSKFSTGLENTELNKWVGPISSGFGEHLVFITDKIAPQLPSLETVKGKVIQDYEYDYQEKISKEIYTLLKQKYDIQIEIESKDFDPKYVEYLQNEMNN